MARTITLRYATYCKECGTHLPVGSKAKYYGSGRVYGTECHSKPTAKKSDKYISNFYYSPSTGNEWYQNKNGRCEDAPCCGCCSPY